MAATTPRRRTVLALVALGVPVLAVLGALGLRAAAGPGTAVDALAPEVAEVAAGIAGSGAGDGFTASGATAGPDRPLSGGSSEAPAGAGTFDVTVVCTSVDGTGARLTVQVEGERVVDSEVACGDVSAADPAPAVTNAPDVPLTGAWSFEVAGGSEAAVAVVVVPM
jgi:opacity protein-like surface antigen